MKIIINEIEQVELGNKSGEIQAHSFLLQIGDMEFRFVQGDAGQLQVYNSKTVLIEPRASNSFYVWNIQRNWEHIK